MSSHLRYTYDASLRVWLTPSHLGTSYSDGTAFEEELLRALQSAHDLRTSSDELANLVRDWPSQYHLSPLRHNLLRPFRFGPGDRILELGCGCGALTRYLGETGANVVAVEGSRRRAAIAAERCRDLPNVSVFCDNLIDFETHERFDVVTLIGVLEYAPVFIASKSPVRACLARAGSFLQPSGRLLLAIENQLGLKYFAGRSEDHVGRPYFGIQDLYGSGTPITMGRGELAAELKASGFCATTFYLPFPDYKVPTTVVSEQALDVREFAVADLLSRVSSRDYSSARAPEFHEGLARRVLARNGLLGELADSFLVVAVADPQAAAVPDWLARIYSADRKAPFATETTFSVADDRIQVAKRLLNPGTERITATPGFVLRHQPATSSFYEHGELYIVRLQVLLGQGAGLDEVAAWSRPWLEYLAAHAVKDSGGQLVLPGHMVDSIPTNLIMDNCGVLTAIDLEWEIAQSIPMKWVLIRGWAASLIASPTSQALRELPIGTIIAEMFERLGMASSPHDYAEAARLEDMLQAAVRSDMRAYTRFAILLGKPLGVISSVPTQHSVLEEQASALQAEINRVKSSASWRLTKPLRAIWNLVLKPIFGRKA